MLLLTGRSSPDRASEARVQVSLAGESGSGPAVHLRSGGLSAYAQVRGETPRKRDCRTDVVDQAGHQEPALKDGLRLGQTLRNCMVGFRAWPGRAYAAGYAGNGGP